MFLLNDWFYNPLFDPPLEIGWKDNQSFGTYDTNGIHKGKIPLDTHLRLLRNTAEV